MSLIIYLIQILIVFTTYTLFCTQCNVIPYFVLSVMTVIVHF